MACYKTVFCMHGILMGHGLGDSCQNHRIGNFETAFSQSGPQVLVGTACQETPPTLPTHCYEELVPRYDVRERPHHRMPKPYNTPKPRGLLPEATQYKAETTHNTTLRLHNTTPKLPATTPTLPWQPASRQRLQHPFLGQRRSKGAHEQFAKHVRRPSGCASTT